MEASTVYYTDFRCPVGTSLTDKLRRLCIAAGIKNIDMEGKFVAIKMHFGELGNLAYLRPNYAKVVADLCKEQGGMPFLTDCNTLYTGMRRNALDHLTAAFENGFSPLQTGCHVIIADGLLGNDHVAVPIDGEYCKEALIGRFGEQEEKVTPEAHAWDGGYTSVKVEFQGVRFRVESCRCEDAPLILLVTPLSRELRAPLLVLESGFLWNRPGVLGREKNTLLAVAGKKRFVVYSTAPHNPQDANFPTQTPYLAADFDREIAFAVNAPLEIAEVRRRMAAAA